MIVIQLKYIAVKINFYKMINSLSSYSSYTKYIYSNDISHVNLY